VILAGSELLFAYVTLKSIESCVHTSGVLMLLCVLQCVLQSVWQCVLQCLWQCVLQCVLQCVW